MGVIINETITLTNGLTVTNPYASTGENEIHLQKTGSVSIVTDNLTNIEEQLYTELKTEYTSYTDDL